jgi:hypothetical protein
MSRNSSLGFELAIEIDAFGIGAGVDTAAAVVSAISSRAGRLDRVDFLSGMIAEGGRALAHEMGSDDPARALAAVAMGFGRNS